MMEIVKAISELQTRIISAFPGTGKTTFYKANKEITLDSDSSDFSWVESGGKKVRNPEFPQNYIDHIKENIGKYEFILVSSHEEVRDALKANCLFFYLVYPPYEDRELYLKRYRERGNSESFVKLLDKNWMDWVRQCKFEERGCSQQRLCSGWYLKNAINHIVCSENGDRRES